jgi:NADPH-dependent 7-cyano-7-deazaguanine reductase QueF
VNSFFNEYRKYNILLSDQNKAYNQILKTIKEVLKTKQLEIEFDN